MSSVVEPDIPQIQHKSIDVLKEEIIDRILLISLVGGLFGVAASCFRALDAGWHPGFLMFILAYFPAAMLALMRNHLSLRFKEMSAIVMIFFYGAGMSLAFGLMSAGVTILVLHGIVATILAGPRAGGVSIMCSTLVLVYCGYLHTNRLVDVAITPGDYAYSINSWLSAGLSFLILSSIIVSIVASLLNRLTAKLAAEESKREHLEQEISALENILPVCAWCRRIRDEHDDWLEVGVYMARHSDTQVSHAICPDCTASMRGSPG